jgi:hypothetical protein
MASVKEWLFLGLVSVAFGETSFTSGDTGSSTVWVSAKATELPNSIKARSVEGLERLSVDSMSSLREWC